MSDAKLRELVKRRGSFKAKLTSFNNFLQLLPKIGLDSFQSSELQCRLSLMEALYKEFDVLETKLELLSENTDDMYAEREQFQTLYYAQVGHAKALLAAARPSSPAPASYASADDGPHHGFGCKHDFVHLPKIDLPHFNGGYQHWLEF